MAGSCRIGERARGLVTLLVCGRVLTVQAAVITGGLAGAGQLAGAGRGAGAISFAPVPLCVVS